MPLNICYVFFFVLLNYLTPWASQGTIGHFTGRVLTVASGEPNMRTYMEKTRAHKRPVDTFKEVWYLAIITLRRGACIAGMIKKLTNRNERRWRGNCS